MATSIVDADARVEVNVDLDIDIGVDVDVDVDIDVDITSTSEPWMWTPIQHEIAGRDELVLKKPLKVPQNAQDDNYAYARLTVYL